VTNSTNYSKEIKELEYIDTDKYANIVQCKRKELKGMASAWAVKIGDMFTINSYV